MKYWIQAEFLLVSLFNILIALGVGNLFSKKIFKIETALSPSMVGLLGLFCVGTLALIYNFFLPLNLLFFALILFLSASGWFLRLEGFTRKTALYLLFIAIGYWMVGIPIGPMSDTNLYHVPIIHWMQLSNLPMGVANLHTRLATWNFWFLVCAGFSAGNLVESSVFSLNIVLVSLAVLDWFRLFKTDQKELKFFLLSIFAYLFLIDRGYFYGGNKSPNADFAGAIVTIWFACYLIKARTKVLMKEAATHIPMTLLSAFAVFLKLSNLPLGIAFAVMVVFFLRNKALFAFIGLTGILMCLRSFMMSGCFIFPLQASCIAVPWRLNDFWLHDNNEWIYRWARDPTGERNSTLHTWQWVPGWWKRNLGQRVMFCFALFPAIYLALSGVFASLKKKLLPLNLPLVALMMASLIFWFVQAPDTRFAYGFLVVLSCEFLSKSVMYFSPLLKTKWLDYAAAFFVLSLLFIGVRRAGRTQDFGTATIQFALPQYVVKQNAQGEPIKVVIGNECGRLPPVCTLDGYWDYGIISVKRGIWTSFEKKL